MEQDDDGIRGSRLRRAAMKVGQPEAAQRDRPRDRHRLNGDPHPGNTHMMRRYTAMRGQDGFDQLTLPAERFVVMRGVMLVIGLLGQLQATNTWFAIAREWLYGDAPVTALGEAEAAFFGMRHTDTTGAAA